MSSESRPNGMSRREMLKKGGLVLGAAAWMTPAMQIINMAPAAAAGDGVERGRGRGSLPSGQITSPIGPNGSWPGSKPSEPEDRSLPRDPNN